jgi:CubicO group peptidase (beta-lactamase class C family)
MKKYLLQTILLVCTILFGKYTFGQSNFIANDLETYINKGLKDWQVPGLALVIVKDGKVVISKGFGVKNIATNEPVDANTAFFIASNSKLFTGMALANLEHEGKLQLTDKITKHFPWFKLYDKSSTEMVTILDMLTHRIGTTTFQGDFTFWNSTLSSKQIMEKMRLLKPSTDFRTEYGYCNSCFLTAGQVLEKVTGTTWSKYITQKMLQPIQMSNSYASSNGIQNKLKNIATPYTTSYTNTLQTVPYDMWDNIAPAASVVSNVNDLSKWLQFQLDSGKVNGKQIIPWPVLQRTRDVQIVTGSRKSSNYPVHFRGYGLGLFSADYNGKQIYWHTGGAAGMVSNVCFVPEENLGIAILTNNDNQSFFEMLRYQILDSYLNVPFTNRSDNAIKYFNEEMENQIKEIETWKSLVEAYKGGFDSAIPDFAKYIGTYNNKLYGTIEISKLDAWTLEVKFLAHSNLSATLKPLANNEWLLQYNNIEYGIFKTNFIIDKSKKVKSVNIKANEYVEYDAYQFDKLN